jgi:hypothetical protein
MVMNRLSPVALSVLALAFGAMAMGCERREPSDPHEFVAAETARVACEPVIVVTDAPDEPREPPATRLRQTVSLGFIGDGPLSDVHAQGYDGGGYTYPPSPYYGHGYGGGYGGSRRGYGAPGVHQGFVGGSSGSHGRFVGRGSRGSSGGGTAHGTFGGGGSHGGHSGGGSHGGHGR